MPLIPKSNDKCRECDARQRPYSDRKKVVMRCDKLKSQPGEHAAWCNYEVCIDHAGGTVKGTGATYCCHCAIIWQGPALSPVVIPSEAKQANLFGDHKGHHLGGSSN